MADDKIDFDPRYFHDPLFASGDQEEADGATAGDYAKSLALGGSDLAKQAIAVGRYGADALGATNLSAGLKGVGQIVEGTSGKVEDTITPGGMRAADAQFVPEDGRASVFEHPADTLMMKGARAAPAIGAAIAVPGSLPAQSALGAGMQVGQTLQQNYELADANPDSGKTGADLTDPADLAGAAVAGGVAGGAIGRLLHGEGLANATPGLTKRVAGGALEGGVGMGAAGAQLDVSRQSAEQDLGKRSEYDPMQTLKAGVNSAFEGAAVGGVLAGVTGSNANRTTRLYDKAGEGVETGARPTAATDAISPDPAQQLALTYNDPVKAWDRAGQDAPPVVSQGAPSPLPELSAPPAKQAVPFPEGFTGRMERPPTYSDPGVIDAIAQRQGEAQVAPGSPDSPVPQEAAPQASRGLAAMDQAQLPAVQGEGLPPEVAPGPRTSDMPSGVGPKGVEALQKASKGRKATRAPKAPEIAPETTTPESAPVAEAPAQAPVPQGRVLEDLRPEAVAATKANAKAATDAIKGNIKEMNTVPVEAGSGAKNWTKAQKAARETNNKAARETVEKFPPVVGESAGQMRDRASNMLKAATEAGWKKPGAVRKNNLADAGHGPETMLLDEAARFVKSTKPEQATHFEVSEKLLRSGKPEAVDDYLRYRREQGQEVMLARNGVKSQAQHEAAGGSPSEPEEGVSSSPPRIDHGDYVEPAVRSRSEQLAEQEAKRAVAERAKNALPPSEGGVVGADKTGTFKVESAKRRVITSQGNPTGEGPKVGPKGAEIVAKAKEKAQERVETKPAPKGLEKLREVQARNDAEREAAKVLGQPLVDQLAEAQRKRTAGRGENAEQQARSIAESIAYHKRNFEALKKDEPDLTPKEYGARVSSGMRMLGEMLSDTEAKDLSDAARRTVERLNGKEGVIRARLNVNENPTDGQKRAGNYAKGHVTFEGHNLAIENPKGAERSGVTPEGNEWSVTMPADYGYIKGTKGHDRDAVDAFIGPRGETGKVFVINQRDLASHAFDEHKVVFGTRSMDEAMDLYRKSFSDGSGDRRAASISEVTSPELKRWLKEGDMHAPYTPHGAVWGENGTLFTPSHSAPFREVLKNLQLSSERGSIQKFVARKLRDLVGDTPVHFVDNATMRAITGSDTPPLGYYDPTNSHIVIGPHENPAKMAHAVLHEMLHAATWHQIMRSTALRKTLRMIMDDIVSRFAATPHVERSYDGDLRFLADHYAFDPEHGAVAEAEFLAEALGNDNLQRLLARMPVSDHVAKALGLKTMRVASAWNAIKAFVRRSLGLPGTEHVHTALEAVMSVAERMEWSHNPSAKQAFDARRMEHQLRAHLGDTSDTRSPELAAHAAQSSLENIKRTLDIAGRGKDVSHLLKTGAAKLMTGHQLYQMTRHATGEVFSKAHEAFNDAANRMNVRMQTLFAPANDLAMEASRLSRKYVGDDWGKFMRLVDEAPRAGVHPDVALDHAKNAHMALSAKNAAKNQGRGDEAAGAFRNWKGRAAHAELHEVYNSLPDELKAFWSKSQGYYAEQAAGAKEASINRMLHGSKLPEEVKAAARAGRVELDAYDEKYRPVLRATNAMHAAFSINGPYFPSYRRGDFVVRGEMKYEKPANGKETAPHTYEFDTREAAHAYATGLDMLTSHSTVYYDSATGERSTKEGALSAENGEVGDAVPKYQVKVNPRLFEAHETIRAAEARRAELEASGKFIDLPAVAMRRELTDRDMELSVPQVKALVDAVDARTDIPDEMRGGLKKSIQEAAIGMTPGNRFAKRMLGKEHIFGRNEELVRDYLDYGRSISSYRARQEFSPELDTHLETMRKDIEDHRYADNVIDKQAVLREIHDRSRYIDTAALGGDISPVVQHAMMLTGLKRMASAGHLLIHMMHPIQMSLPVLAARHGMRAASEIARVYKDISALDMLREGGAGFARMIRDPEVKSTNFLENMKERLASQRDGKELGKMLDALVESGHIHPDNLLDFSRITAAGNATERAMYRVDSAFRELSGAAEMINRAVDAVASYRLERAAGKSHEEAVRYAKDTVASTQGFYSAANRIPLAKGNFGRMGFQFKGYMQNVLALIAESLHTGLKDSDPATRREAWKRLAFTVGTAGALGGVVGLPVAMDAAKLALIIANAAGLTSYTYGSFEDDMRRTLAKSLGAEGAGVAMHGVGHAFGLNVGHRLGAGGVLFGEPDSYDARGTLAYFGGFVMGAAPQAVAETVEGGKLIMEGRVAEGMGKLLPVKQLEDAAKATQLYTEGKKTKRGETLVEPISAPAAAMQAFGIQPASVSDRGAARAAIHDRMVREREERTRLLERITRGGISGPERAKAMQAISAWNRAHPENRITASHIHNAATEHKSSLGYRVNKRNRELLREYEEVYGE